MSTEANTSIEAKTLHDSMHRAFAAFRETNDERLSQIEDRLGADVVTEDKLDRIGRALDETKSRLDRVQLDLARPALGASDREDPRRREHKAAFETYVRAGEASGLKALEAKALSAGSGADGGYLVPQAAEREILRRMARLSPIRSIATVQEISTSSLRKAFSYAGPAAGWVAETDARPQTATQQIADMTFPAMELYAMPAATQTLLDDAAVDIEQWVADEVYTVFAEQEGAAFVNGSGINKPKGFLAYSTVADASWTFGNLGYVATGVAGSFAGGSPSDALIDLVYALRAGYRTNGKFVMSRRTQQALRKFKSTTGEYLWEPPSANSGQPTLMGFPVVEAEDMPDIATGSFSVAFGDFERGYIVVDRIGIRILRDPYSNKPYVLFYTTKRVGGGVQDFAAIKLLKFDVS